MQSQTWRLKALPAHHSQTYRVPRIVTTGAIRYILINKTWHFFPPPLQSGPSTSLGRDVNVISFHMALQRANVTAESCSALPPLSLPTFSLCSAPLCSLLNTGGSWVYYLPPPAPEERGTIQKVGLLPGLSTANAASKVSVMSRSNSEYKNTDSKSFYSLT